MDVQILDTDYMLVNGRPVIRFFGRGDDGKSVCVFHEGFLPYFYAYGCDEKRLKEEPDVYKIERMKRKIVGNRNETDVFKVTLFNPVKVPEIRERLMQGGIEVFEADILFKYRFMADRGLAGFDWISVPDTNGIGTDSVKVDRKVKIGEIKIARKDKDAQLRYLAFDIECVSGTGGVPEASKDPVLMISVVFSEEHKGKDGMLLSTRQGKNILSFESEAEMLENFIDIVNDFDPDVVTAFNGNNFDLPYILERMSKNGIKALFGRCMQKPAGAKKVGIRYKVTIPGRVMVDSYEIVKKDFSLQRYGLDFVAERLLKQKKDSVRKSEIEKLWKGSQEEYERLANYCLKDSKLALNLLLELNLLEKYIALSKVSGILLQDTLNGGETARIENYLLREFNEEGYMFPSKPKHLEETGLTGGEVLEPAKGLHSNVAVLDFRSMYPSIIQSFNICPTTLTEDKENSLETPSGSRFLKSEIMMGIIPRILKELTDARQTVKKELKNCRDAETRRLLNAKQWALKILANAFYGYFGYTKSRLYNLAIANAITSCGRKIILDTKAVIEKEFDYKVVYGDTDSVFVRIHDKEEFDDIAAVTKSITDKVNTRLPAGIELEFEKIFKRFLPLSKKRYAAWKFVKTGDGWVESIETKGIETVRRDWCDLVGVAVMDELNIVLKENDKKKAVEYFRKVVEKLLKGEIPLQNLVITKTMTKMPRNYAGVQPHIEVVKKMQSRNSADVPGIGDRIGYVIVKGMQMLSKRAEDPAYVLEKGLQIDSHYYIENQLLPPLERLFGAMGVSKNELLGSGRQVGLLDVIRNQAKMKQEIRDEVSISKVTGFVCTGCSKSYSRIPLIGVCECGSELLFSTSEGPAKAAVLEND
ncbi:MAG: ribonuclease H-like domain-containing protein [Candidatus Aenigmarchaeota archaeon]|nr:ribonuclease H-like domain-containing protein [Candidatus Aenigmarchaeota archaeon]